MEAKERVKGKRRIEIVQIDDSDTEDELVAAIPEPKKSRPTALPESSSVPIEAILEGWNPLAAIFGDRAQMEKERLQRQRKRRLEAGLTNDEEGEESAGNDKAPLPEVPKPSLAALQAPAPTPHENGRQYNDLYWNGTVKVRATTVALLCSCSKY